MSPPPSPAEAFQPRAHWAPTTARLRLLFAARLLVDLQTRSIHRDLRGLLGGVCGRLLDIGCGNSPYRQLLDAARTTYTGIDVETAASFGYRNPDTVYYDGRTFPFPDAFFDALLCTEVLEHVAEPAGLIREMHRVLKPGGLGLITIPWSARYHYQPIDYHRYTPSMLASLLGCFAEVHITPRGTDFSAIASKIVVAYARNILRLRPVHPGGWLLLLPRLFVVLLGLPVLLGALVLGHCGVSFALGSADDPLGYTIRVRK